MSKLLQLVLSGVLIGASGMALADSYHVRVWNGTATNCQQTSCLFNENNADRPPPAADPLATFDFVTDSNGINWATQFSDYSSLLQNGQITGFTSSESLQQFLNSSYASNTSASFFEITGNYTSDAAFNASVLHNAGASLYIDNTTQAIFQPGLVGSGQIQSGTYGFAGGVHNFSLYYVAADSGPSALRFDMPNARGGFITAQQVPEPASLSLFGAALAGLALFRRRKA